MKNFTLECCVDSTTSAIEAEKGGATRLELCSNLVIGGTSPSISLFKQIRKNVNLPIRVLLRPRFGDFCYTQDEIEVLQDEIKTFVDLGADGIVIGCLTPDGKLDMDNMQKFMELAKNTPVTLHRAFDLCENPMKTLEQAKKLGVSTILTSGSKASALDGMEVINNLCSNAGDIEILAGAGITSQTIKLLTEKTKLTSFHMSGKKIIQSKMEYRNKNVFMGLKGLSEYEIYQTDCEQIRLAREILEKA